MTSKRLQKRKAPPEDPEPTKHDEPKPSSASPTPPTKTNAFTTLMTPKPQPKKTKYSDIVKNGLGAYLDHPETFPPSQVIGFNENAVYIWDLYPKGSVHALILPRDVEKRDMNPYDAFSDKKFLDEMTAEAQKLKTLVAKELKRMYGKYSEADKKRAEYEKRLANGEVKEREEVPEGRNWEAEVKVGFHSRPSMNHLHVHVLSKDCHSPCIKKGQHYNTFHTSFFVDLKDLPFEGKQAEDARKALADSEVAGSYICWRCNKSFGRKFKEFKEHLETEFEAWKKE